MNPQKELLWGLWVDPKPRNSIKDDMADARAKGCITKEASAIRVYAGPV